MIPKKVLVAGLVLLFIGASVVPTLGGYIGQMDKVATLESEKDGRSGSSDWLGNQQITSAGSSENPVIQTDSLDNMNIVWSDNRAGNYQIYYKKLDSNGNQLIADKQISFTTPTANAQYSSMGIDNANNIHIVWQDSRNGGTWQIYYSKIDSNGNVLVNNSQITTLTTSSQYPVIKISEANNVHIAWQDLRDGNYEIYYKKFTNNGVVLIPDTRITLENSASEHPSIALYSDYLANIVWQENRSGNPEIYYDEVQCDLFPISISYSSSGTPSSHLAIEGFPLTVTAIVHNSGDIAVTNVGVDVLLDGATPIVPLQYISSISANSNGSVTFPPWTIPPSSFQGRHNLVLRVDPGQLIPDVDRTNNNMTKYLPILDPTNVHTTAWPQSYSYSYPSNTIIACNQLVINSGYSLSLLNSDLIIFNPGPPETISGGFSALNSIITTSDPSEYIPQFSIGGTGSQSVQITGCCINQLAGNGIWINRPSSNLIISGNTITNSQGSAITCSYTGGVYNFDNNIIYNSGSSDFQITSSSTQVNVIDSFFTESKVNIITGSQFSYGKHIDITVYDENNTPVNNAYVEIKNQFGFNVSWGYTNTTGHFTPSQPLQVFLKTGPSTFTEYGPFDVSTRNQSSGSFCGMPLNMGGGLFYPNVGHFNANLLSYSQTKYALLIAGNLSLGGRLESWNDIEFAYHVLKDIKCYKPENIIVLYGDGLDGEWNHNAIINNTATKANVQNTLQYFGGKMVNNATQKDTLFIYTADHGGLVNSTSSLLCMNSGVNLGSYQLADMLNTYLGKNVSKIYIVMNQCYGAGFIRALHADNRVIQTASKQNYDTAGETWGYNDWQEGAPYYHYEGNTYFSVEYWSALHNHDLADGTYPDQNMTYYPTDWYTDPYGQHNSDYYHNTSKDYVFKNLDDDGNKQISLQEAFDYALDNDLTGPVDGRAGYSWEFPQQVDDDVVVIAGLFGQIMIYRYDSMMKLSGTSVNIGGVIRKIFVRDMNNDGYDDIVAVDSQDDQVFVLLNKGDWTFNTSTYAVGDEPWGLAVADVNWDGWLDIVTTNFNDNDISVLLNNKDGTFGQRKDYDVGNEPLGIAAADISLDGKPDLVVTNWGGDYYDNKTHYNISVLTNDGSGGFNVKTNYSVPGQPSAVAIGDLDKNGANDLVVTLINPKGYGPGNVNVLKNSGGVFSNYTLIKAGNYPVSPYFVDLNNNGTLDLLVPNFLDHSVMVYRDNGTGGFIQVGNYSTGVNTTLMGVFEHQNSTPLEND